MSDRRQPLNFLPALAGRSRTMFNYPVNTERSAGGVVYRRSSGVGFWQGSVKFPPQLPRERLARRDAQGAFLEDEPTHLKIASDGEVLAFLRSKDKNGGYFFADIMLTPKGVRIDRETNNLPTPQWHTIPRQENMLDRTRKVLRISKTAFTGTDAANYDDMREGDVVSFRESQTLINGSKLENYVTARVIEDRSETTNNYIFTFDYHLPRSYLEDPDNIVRQFCYNRPHVRAIMTNNPSSWQNGPGYIDINAVDWVEDSVDNKGATGISSDIHAFALSDGSLFLLNSGGTQFYLSVESDEQ